MAGEEIVSILKDIVKSVIESEGYEIKGKKEDSSTSCDDNKQIVEMAIKDYDRRYTENLKYIELYHKHMTFLYTYFSILGAIISQFLFNKDLLEKINTSIINNDFINKYSFEAVDTTSWIYEFFIIMAMLILYHIVATLMNTLFLLQLNGSRMASIEKFINQKLNNKILNWESEVIKHFFSQEKITIGSCINPNHVNGIFPIFFALLISLGIAAISHVLQSNEFAKYNSIGIILITLLLISQWIALTGSGKEYMNQTVDYLSGVSEFTPDKLKGIEVTIAVLTVAVGYLPMLILSWYSNTLWPSSNCDFPFFRLPTIYFGDLILLPLINYRFTILLKHLGIDFFKRNIMFVIVGVLISLVSSYYINIFNHNNWIKDQYFGFMDTTLGVLSEAGYWHACFSFFQMTVIFSFIFIWYITYKEEIKGIYTILPVSPFSLANKVFFYIFLFNLGPILDFAVKLVYVYKYLTVEQIISMEYLTFLLPTISFIILRWTYDLEKALKR